MSILEMPSSPTSREIHYKILNEPCFIDINSKYEEDELLRDTLNENLRILSEIRIPEWFDRKEIESMFSSRISKSLEESPIFQSETKVYRYTREINRHIKEYFAMIYNHQDNVIKDIQRQIFSVSIDFHNSDLPPSFLRIVSLSFKTEQRFESIYKKRVRTEEVKLRLSINNYRKLRRAVDEHNAWVERVDPFIDDMRGQVVALLWYVNIWNSRTMDEIFERKKWKTSCLEKIVFEEMLNRLESMTMEVRRRLINLDRKEFAKAVDEQDPTISLLANSMMVLNELTA